MVEEEEEEEASNLTPSQRYAASALFAIALNQAQISQTKPLGIPTTDDGVSDGESENRRIGEPISTGDDTFSDDVDLGVTRFLVSSDPFSGNPIQKRHRFLVSGSHLE